MLVNKPSFYCNRKMTTLTNAGGDSLVSNGTGPALEIKGLIGDLQTQVGISGTTLSIGLKTGRQSVKFIDDFYYHNNGGTTDLANASNPFQKSNIWLVESTYLRGTTITETKPWPSTGDGVIAFLNHLAGSNQGQTWPNYDYSGAWKMTARNAAIVISTNRTIFEAKIWIDTPYNGNWWVNIGFIIPDGRFTGFKFDPTASSNLLIAIRGSYIGSSNPSLPSLMDKWLTLRIEFNASAGETIYYINGTSVATYSGQMFGFYYTPYISTGRDGYLEYYFYIDYIGYSGDIIRYQL